MAEAQTAPKTVKTVKAIKYVGRHDVRKITKAQWASIGVDDQNEVVWDAKNGHTVKESDLSKKALAYFEKDPGFKSVDVEA
jgi:hypothetical protein